MPGRIFRAVANGADQNTAALLGRRLGARMSHRRLRPLKVSGVFTARGHRLVRRIIGAVV